MKQVIFCAIFATAMVTSAARADCTWTWDCTSGECHQVPLCDLTLDIPPIEPIGIPPISPIPPIPPIATPMIPPIGTSSCSPTYICNGFGQCEWQTVCE